MAQDISYDDTNLQRLFAEMAPKQRAKALRGAFRRAANQVRKAALENLRSSIRSDKDLERGVRTVVYKRVAGFKVTVGTKKGKLGRGGYGYHKNRQGLEKPVLIWAEDGTASRSTKGIGRVKRSTGRMKRYGFMHKTLEQTKGNITSTLHNEIRDNVQKVAKKYGCK